MPAQLPKWARNQSWLIEAKADGNPTKDQMRLMMQSLLAHRFKLRVHFETREGAVLAGARQTRAEVDSAFPGTALPRPF